jgi:hypothetical protein
MLDDEKSIMRRYYRRSNDSYLYLAIEVLTEKNKKMDLETITKEILERRKKNHAKTPKKSIYSALWRAEQIIKYENGQYGLKKWE